MKRIACVEGGEKRGMLQFLTGYLFSPCAAFSSAPYDMEDQLFESSVGHLQLPRGNLGRAVTNDTIFTAVRPVCAKPPGRSCTTRDLRLCNKGGCWVGPRRTYKEVLGARGGTE